jgi:NAD(P)-dependent dehydrogenase (short-subunit alcohol dehydrogenase family)
MEIGDVYKYSLADSTNIAALTCQYLKENPEEAAEFLGGIPMRRVGECEEDIGRFVAMLCTEDARYVNGQSIGLDGGQAYLG